MTHYRRALLHQATVGLRWWERAGFYVAVFVMFAWHGLVSIWEGL